MIMLNVVYVVLSFVVLQTIIIVSSTKLTICGHMSVDISSVELVFWAIVEYVE